MKRFPAPMLAFALAVAHAAAAQVGATMTAGRLVGAGYPGPLVSTPAGVGARNASGSGSTGGGLGGVAQVGIAITDDPTVLAGGSTRMRVTGSATHGASIGFGYTAVQSANSSDSFWRIELTVTESATFSITNASTAAATAGGARKAVTPVRFTALTGTISGNELSAGTYAVEVWIGAFFPNSYQFDMPSVIKPGYANFASTGAVDVAADWTLVLSPIVSCAPADLDCNGTVDMGDVAFALLDFGPCPGCTSDLDRTGVVDFGDIALIMLDFG